MDVGTTGRRFVRRSPGGDGRVAVIGAGPAGATAALELARRGVQVDLYEASDAVGGLARTIELWGQRVDLGPHRFFSSDRRINSLWLSIVGTDYAMVDRLTRIHYRGKLFQYPLQPGQALRHLGPLEAARCVADYARERLRPTEQDGSFERWVVGRFGRRLYEIFFRTYSEKLWGIPCTELDADFAAQRIKGLSLAGAIVNALKSGRNNTHKTLVDRFAYPHGGTGRVYERMVDELRDRGGRARMATPVRRVLLDDGRVSGIETETGEVASYDHVVSTMPITLLLKGLPEVPAEVTDAAAQLRFRNTLIVFLEVDRSDLFPDQWMYLHSADMQMGRLTNFRNWVPDLYRDRRTTILACEYWAYDEDDLWRSDDAALIELATRELAGTGLLQGAPVARGHVERLRRCYPVYSRGYRDRLSVVESHLESIHGLWPIGRYGAFKYNNQDHSILMGMLVAENIAGDAGNDLWSVNTDYETYQEKALITEAGLS
ncbi:MAG: FAD-dependent oxidoreductase [Thermoleophilia bacterium]